MASLCAAAPEDYEHARRGGSRSGLPSMAAGRVAVYASNDKTTLITPDWKGEPSWVPPTLT